MKKLILLTLCVALSGCAWFKANEKALSADSLALLGCVVSTAGGGATVELTALTCGPMLIQDVVAILDEAKVTPVPSPALAKARLTTNPLKKPAS